MHSFSALFTQEPTNLKQTSHLHEKLLCTTFSAGVQGTSASVPSTEVRWFLWAQRITFLSCGFEMCARNGETSAEDSILFKRIEK